MMELVIGAALVCGATWLGRTKQSRLGIAIAKAITPGMTDDDFVDELHYRAQQADGLVDSAMRDLYDAAQEDLSDNPDCGSAKMLYMQSRDSMKESQRAMRSPRIPRLVTECTGSGRLRKRGTEKCRRFLRGKRMHEQAIWALPFLHEDIKTACNQTMPAPFSGAS